MFPFDADCAVEFKRSDGSTTITAHDPMRVDYAVVSGGCTLTDSPTTSSGAASSGVVSSTFKFNQVRASCEVSFTAYFGTTDTVSATMQNPASQTRTVVASSVVFGTALAAGPLVAGTPYGFTCEALLLMQARNRRQHACTTHACVNHAPHVPI